MWKKYADYLFQMSMLPKLECYELKNLEIFHDLCPKFQASAFLQFRS
jgi:hypothetical protein